ncbi:MAG: hypothetical protein K2X42_08970, partial [Burkholderiaceae bacterium]|nr:hypothetical protein [Burkholderiaceae bacterium]
MVTKVTAEAALLAGSANQVVPPSVEYCQAPLLLSMSWALMAMPARVLALEPPLTWSVASL